MMEAVLIERLFAREIIDSRGYPTIETDVLTKIGVFRTSIPSGASTGIHEALEIRDHDPKRFHGKGVLHAVEIVNTILNYHLHGWDVTKQKEIDEEMKKLDGTPSKENLGANSNLSVSIAVSKQQRNDLFIVTMLSLLVTRVVCFLFQHLMFLMAGNILGIRWLSKNL